MIDISHITTKFPHYRSREALQDEHTRTTKMMEDFLSAMHDDLVWIKDAGYTLSVFWMLDSERTIHCGLYHCCENPPKPGPPQIRRYIEIKIYETLPYDKIVWHI